MVLDQFITMKYWLTANITKSESLAQNYHSKYFESRNNKLPATAKSGISRLSGPRYHHRGLHSSNLKRKWLTSTPIVTAMTDTCWWIILLWHLQLRYRSLNHSTPQSNHSIHSTDYPLVISSAAVLLIPVYRKQSVVSQISFPIKLSITGGCNLTGDSRSSTRVITIELTSFIGSDPSINMIDGQTTRKYFMNMYIPVTWYPYDGDWLGFILSLAIRKLVLNYLRL